MKNKIINENGTEIRACGDVVNEDAYICLTDIAKKKNPTEAALVISHWLRNRSTIDFWGLWEQLHNPNFKPTEFGRFKYESGEAAFTLMHLSPLDGKCGCVTCMTCARKAFRRSLGIEWLYDMLCEKYDARHKIEEFI